MQETLIFLALLVLVFFALGVYVEYLRLKLEEEKFEHEKSLDANGRTGRDLDNGQFTSLKKSKKAKKVKKLG